MTTAKHRGFLALLAAGVLTIGCGDDETDGSFPGGGLGDTGGGNGDPWDGGDGGDGGGGDGGGDKLDIGGGGDDDGGFLDDPDIGGMPPPPEEEEPADFRVPKASGKFVYSASEVTNRVAVINTDNLIIDVVDSGKGPTVVAPIPGQSGGAGAVAVLCERSDEVTFIRTDNDGKNTTELRDIAPAANNLEASPDGKLVIAYHDVDAPGQGGAGSDQEISVIETKKGGEVYRLTVGSHPRAVDFTSSSDRAYVTTDDGVNVLDLTDVAGIGLPDLIPVVLDTGIDPETLEIHISVTQRQALARVEGDNGLIVTDLVSEEQFEMFFPAYPTDLDMAADGTFAILTAPDKMGSRVFEVELPVQPPGFTEHSVGAEYVGLAKLAPDNDTLILYTSVDPWGVDEDPPLGDPRKRVTILRRDGDGDWTDKRTLFAEVPLRGAGIAPDSANAILLHYEAPELNQAAPWPYTLLDLKAPFPITKIQNVEAKPGSIVFTPDGTRAGVLLRDDPRDVRRLDMVNLQTFIVKDLGLGSPPEGAGYVDATDKLFISQAHPSGRITFVDDAGAVQTVTGYELNDAVKD